MNMEKKTCMFGTAEINHTLTFSVFSHHSNLKFSSPFNNFLLHCSKPKHLWTETSQSIMITAFCQSADHKPVRSSRSSTDWPSLHLFCCIHPGRAAWPRDRGMTSGVCKGRADRPARSARAPAVHTLRCSRSRPGRPQLVSQLRTAAQRFTSDCSSTAAQQLLTADLSQDMVWAETIERRDWWKARKHTIGMII